MNSATSHGTEPVTAWYGKLPARGDFVGQGLPPAWVEGWDHCLQQVLRLGELRHFPPWRFLVWPAPEDAHGPVRAGVLVSSHDRVGRVFPLTVVQALAPYQLQGRSWPGIEAALARLADAALDVTDTADPVLTEDFIAVLSALGPVFEPVKSLGTARGLRPDVPGACSLWWRQPAPGAAPQPQAHPWPPEPERLHALLSAAADLPAAAPSPAAPGSAPHTPS